MSYINKSPVNINNLPFNKVRLVVVLPSGALCSPLIEVTAQSCHCGSRPTLIRTFFLSPPLNTKLQLLLLLLLLCLSCRTLSPAACKFRNLIYQEKRKCVNHERCDKFQPAITTDNSVSLVSRAPPVTFALVAGRYARGSQPANRSI